MTNYGILYIYTNGNMRTYKPHETLKPIVLTSQYAEDLEDVS
jgi:hypothetical protein